MKNYKNYLAQLFTLVGILALGACTSTTNITATWDNPDAKDQMYDNVLVTAMIDNVSARQSIENELVDELEERGVKATKGIDLFPPQLRDEKMGSKEDLLNAIKENRFAAVITIALIDEQSETRYVPGNFAYAPMSMYGYYGTFWGYYNYWYPQVYNPGYYDVDKSYFLETNIYDAESEKLVWSAQSKTVNPNSLDRLSEDFADKIIESLEEENLVAEEEENDDMAL